MVDLLLIAAILIVFLSGTMNAQAVPYARTYSHSKEEVDNALKELQAYAGQKLPVVDGFVGMGQLSLARYERAFYQFSIELLPGDSGGTIVRLTAKIAERQAMCDFMGVASGTYAVSVVHDENSNGKLDRNFIGVPREGVGASNDAKGHMGPPKFNAASFEYKGSRLDLKIHVNYL